ncbi:SAM-dependent methyltransferase [Azorhizophilus paspali]|uniref:SAM-dependent methyltransferase n=1 Tax=Azorhizophilus paspali TaxID=69963 RepID=A0ABV6SGP9_AZOPA
MQQAIIELFADLPLQGPGCDEDTLEVLERIKRGLPSTPRIADFGCGTGRSSLALARSLPNAKVTAVDALPLFIETLQERSRSLDLHERIQVQVSDMLAPDMLPASLDLIWSEGAAYAVGFETALRAWRPLLNENGRCVLSECEWLAPDRPAEVQAFWDTHYPAMGDRTANLAHAEAAGYRVMGTHELSAAGWTNYYSALAAAVDVNRTTLDPTFVQAIEQEIAIRALGSHCFGYVFYLLEAS